MADKNAGSGGDNPFRRALQPNEESDPAQSRPFERAEAGRPNPRKAADLRTIAELKLVDRRVLDRTPKIAELTVHDLNDLASEFSGIPTSNPRVAELTIEDIQDIEAVFMDFKLRTGRELQRGSTTQLQVDVSCCCCTPCCCCAAADMSHTA